MVIGKRERENSHRCLSELLMHCHCDLMGVNGSGKRDLFKWHLGPSKTTIDTGILNRNQSEALSPRASAITGMTECLN